MVKLPKFLYDCFLILYPALVSYTLWVLLSNPTAWRFGVFVFSVLFWYSYLKDRKEWHYERSK
jgi:hypothetical protein